MKKNGGFRHVMYGLYKQSHKRKQIVKENENTKQRKWKYKEEEIN